MLLLFVAISWSQANAGPLKRSIAKRSTEEILDEDAFAEEIVMQIFAEILLLGATVEEKEVLDKKFEDVLKMKFNNTEECAKKLLEVFEEVTGRKFSLDESAFFDSSESVDKSDVDSPLAVPRALQV